MVLHPETPSLYSCWRCTCGHIEVPTPDEEREVSRAVLGASLPQQAYITPPARQEIHVDGEMYDITCPVTPTGTPQGTYAQIIATMLGALAEIPAVREAWEKHGITVNCKDAPHV
jgi:hypothetical protein